MHFRKSFLQKVERLFSQKCEDENFLFKPIGKTLLPLLFLSPGARKFFMLTKISQEIQIFAKSFREISFYSLIFHLIKSAQLCVFSQVISSKGRAFIFAKM
jgi:hypothetical protein